MHYQRFRLAKNSIQEDLRDDFDQWSVAKGNILSSEESRKIIKKEEFRMSVDEFLRQVAEHPEDYATDETDAAAPGSGKK